MDARHGGVGMVPTAEDGLSDLIVTKTDGASQAHTLQGTGRELKKEVGTLQRYAVIYGPCADACWEGQVVQMGAAQRRGALPSDDGKDRAPRC